LVTTLATDPRMRRSPSAVADPIIAAVPRYCALVLVAVILSACGVGALTPEPSTTTDSSSSEDAAPRATAGTTHAAEPSVAPYPPVVPTPAGILPPDSVARATVRGLRVRAEPPGLAGYEQVLYSLSVADLVLVVSSAESYVPPEASPDGRGWYEVHVGGAEVNSYADGGINGWVAEGENGLEWLEPDPLICRGSDTLVGVLLPPSSRGHEWATRWERLACYGARQLELEGVAEVLCFDAPETSYTFTPDFLASPSLCSGLVVDDIDADGYHSGLALDLRYRKDAAWPLRGDLLRASGHFDDPASSTCAAESAFGPSRIDPTFLVLFCRELFVVDEFAVIGHRDLAPLPGEQ